MCAAVFGLVGFLGFVLATGGDSNVLRRCTHSDHQSLDRIGTSETNLVVVSFRADIVGMTDNDDLQGKALSNRGLG